MPYKGPALCGRRAGTVLPAGSGSNVCKCRTMVKNKFYICINRAEPPLRPQVSEGGGSAHAPAMGIAEEGAKGRRRQKTGAAEGKRRERGEEGEGKRPFCLPHAGFVREEGEKGRVGRREGEEGGALWSFPSGLMASRCARVGAGEGAEGQRGSLGSGLINCQKGKKFLLSA